MTTTFAKPDTVAGELNDQIPPLENGDRLTRGEFERRYEAMPYVRKAELIEGVVYMPSPVHHKKHGRPHAAISGWLSDYWQETDGVDVGMESSLRLDMENEPQPDVCLFVLPEFGGQATISDDDYIEGAPELVVEVASSSTSIDMHHKLRAYRRNGVREYIVWLVRTKQIKWFVLRGGEYVELEPDAGGIIHSEVFPGLALDADAMIKGDKRRVAQVQREALNTPEHSMFVARLAEKAASGAE
jgi:Uma2 family endonuclease